MPRHARLTVLALAATMATLAAQETPTAGGRPPLPRTASRSWSETTSRDLFAGCDADADDRLDLFEACDALESLQDPKNREAFQRLDTDRDGYLSWPEFDQHYWSVVQLGNTFHVRPCRSQIEQAPEQKEARAATALQRFLGLHDANGNGTLEPGEVDALIARTKVPPNVAAQLRGADRDQSGAIDESELAPWFETLRGHVPEASAPAAAPQGGALLPPWNDNDADRNGKIDAKELAAALRRLDPSLARWAEHLLRLLDRNKDGVLDADELPLLRRPQRETPSSARAGTGTNPRVAGR